jgi:hypothetical protein
MLGLSAGVFIVGSPPALYLSGDPDVGVLDCVRFGRVHFGCCGCRRTVENHLCFCCVVGGCRSAVEGNGILATQVSNQDTAVLLHYP